MFFTQKLSLFLKKMQNLRDLGKFLERMSQLNVVKNLF